MAQLIIVDGKPITIFDDNDFEQLLRDKIGNDAADYFVGHKARLLDELMDLKTIIKSAQIDEDSKNVCLEIIDTILC